MKRIIKKNAVVLGADVNGLGQIRSLGKMGISSYVVFNKIDHKNIARFSKYCTPLYVENHTYHYEQILLSSLIGLAKKENTKLVLYPTSDFYVNFIASNHKVLQEYFLYRAPNVQLLDLIVNKHKTDRVARKLGLHSPNTIQIKADDTIEEISNSISFPCIIKPKNSFSFAFPGKNKIANTKEKLLDFFLKYPELKNQIIIQEIIPGGEDNIYQCTAYFGAGKIKQFFTMQKIHQRPPGYGVTTIGRSIIVPELIKKTEKLLEGLNYIGFASVEYKKSDKNSRYYLIEINPRLPWYNKLFLSCGVNFPYLAYSDMLRESEINFSPLTQKDNVYWMHFKNELSALMKRKKSGLSLNFFEVIQLMAKVRSFACFDLVDLKPFFASMVEFIFSIKSKISMN